MQSEQEPDRRRLPSSVGSQKAVHLSSRDGQVEPVERHGSAVMLAQAVSRDGGSQWTRGSLHVSGPLAARAALSPCGEHANLLFVGVLLGLRLGVGEPAAVMIGHLRAPVWGCVLNRIPPRAPF